MDDNISGIYSYVYWIYLVYKYLTKCIDYKVGPGGGTDHKHIIDIREDVLKLLILVPII